MYEKNWVSEEKKSKYTAPLWILMFKCSVCVYVCVCVLYGSVKWIYINEQTNDFTLKLIIYRLIFFCYYYSMNTKNILHVLFRMKLANKNSLELLLRNYLSKKKLKEKQRNHIKHDFNGEKTWLHQNQCKNLRTHSHSYTLETTKRKTNAVFFACYAYGC